jgi:hypothetical protein
VGGVVEFGCAVRSFQQLAEVLVVEVVVVARDTEYKLGDRLLQMPNAM